MNAMYSFIIPNINGAELLPRCLNAIKQQSIPTEAIVVDNGSTDASASIVSAYGGVKWVEGSRGGGYAQAINKGIAEATGEWIVLFNNDAFLAPDWTEALGAVQASRPDMRVFACQGICERDHTRYYSLGEVFNNGIPIRVGYKVDRASLDLETVPEEVTGASGYCGVYHRDVFRTVGLLEDRFISYFEDVDLNIRCQRYGFACLLAKQAVVYHLGAATGARTPMRWSWLSGRNSMWYLRRHFGGPLRSDIRTTAWKLWFRPVLSRARLGSRVHIVRLLGMCRGMAGPYPQVRIAAQDEDPQWTRRLEEVWARWHPLLQRAEEQ